ncbi:hypothetical protein A6F68_01675 [Tsuneonella dongtanensis]|uniref:Ice-binding protein C-terminal domain-containing protein n=1 Tax=Tsuneonella dongtanensis TaxID=692370 RepID=A0A1B2ADM4_9SPHN|nr:PEP-CTERM sorting domain-containing protein [Tsuneonella dongtanensis]ANY20188.1 hypothetical protein A6F68_01675 [Tsuneonella dongtanensis]
MRDAFTLFLLVLPAPAMAASTAVAEPSNLMLFGLGVLGVVVGRQTSRRKRD